MKPFIDYDMLDIPVSNKQKKTMEVLKCLPIKFKFSSDSVFTWGISNEGKLCLFGYKDCSHLLN